MRCTDCKINVGDCPFKELKLENPAEITGCTLDDDRKSLDLASALREIAAGNLDDETTAQFAERCVRVAKEALR